MGLRWMLCCVRYQNQTEMITEPLCPQTPSGEVLPSSAYSGGEYILQLRNPVLGGIYRCEVPPSAASRACLNAR